MSQEDITARDAARALFLRAAEADINPFSLWNKRKTAKATKVIPVTKRAAQQQVDIAKAELDRARETAKVFKLAEGCSDQLQGLADRLRGIGQDDTANDVEQLITTLHTIVGCEQ